MTKPNAAALVKTEHARRAAIAGHDLAALEAMTADTFYYAHINGLVENRAQYFTRLRKNDQGTRIHATSASELSVEIRAGYALLNGSSHIESTAGTFDTLFLAVWEADADGWKIAAYASTPMPRNG